MKRSIKTRFMSLFTMVAFLFGMLSFSVPAMAEENTVSAESFSSEAQMLRNKIDALRGEDKETRDSYLTDYWGYVEVSGEHTGSYHTIYGHQARMAIAFKPLDGNSALDADLSTGFWSWVLHYNPWYVDSDGYYMYVGNWCNITYMGAYRMYYRLMTTGGSYYDEPVEREGAFHVWVDYK